LPPGKRSLFNDETPDELAKTEEDADEVLLHAERVAFHDSSADLDENHLDNESEDDNTHELGVSCDTGEDVEFTVLDLTGVDLVEELHEHEGLEDHGVMDEFLGWSTFFLTIREDYLDVFWAFTQSFKIWVLQCLSPA